MKTEGKVTPKASIPWQKLGERISCSKINMQSEPGYILDGKSTAIGGGMQCDLVEGKVREGKGGFAWRIHSTIKHIQGGINGGAN